MGLRQGSEYGFIMFNRSHLEVRIGPFHSLVYGGPYRDYRPGQRRLVGVKMAVEIDAPHDISIPTKDFDVPLVMTLTSGLKQACTAIAEGNDLYVGCMGGVGRTGLFMACLVKCLSAAGMMGHIYPVDYVRKNYNNHAVETAQQMEYVEDFDTTPVVEHISWLLDRYKVVVKVPGVVREVVREVPMTVWQSIATMLGFYK